MKQIKQWQCGLFAAMILVSPGLAGCGDNREEQGERYVSSNVQGQSARINLEAVKQAFWSTQGQDFNSWMGGFEQRVNEIYDGSEMVAIDAARKTNMLAVTGFIDKNNQPGYQAGDEKLFAIEQTGRGTNDQVPYRMSGAHGDTYYQGHQSVLGNPFLQGLLIGGAVGHFSGRYYTPRTRYVALRDHRTSFRSSASYEAQRKANTTFSSRYKLKGDGKTLESSRKFGNSTTGTDKKRSWSGKRTEPTGAGTTATTNTTKNTGSSWSGKRSSGSNASSATTKGSSSSWGGRRSNSSATSTTKSSGSSWGGRRSSSSSSSSSSRRSSSSSRRSSSRRR